MSVSIKFLRILVCGIVAAGFIFSPVLALALEGVSGEKNEIDVGRKSHFTEMCKILKLSGKQQSQLDQNRLRHMAVYKDLMEQIFAKRNELHNALQDPQLDITEVTLIHKELVDLIIKQEDRHLAAILEVRKVLTKEQFALFQQMTPDTQVAPQDPRSRSSQ